MIAPVRFGGYAERAVARADGVVALRDDISFEHGATIPIAYATAWEALIRAGNLQPGERVLIQAAAGGVGIAATQIAKRAGGRLVCFGASGVVSGESRNLLAAARTALQMPRFNVIKQMSDSKAVIGLNVLSIWDELQSADRWRKPLTELLADGTIQPVLAEAFPFARAPEAHRFISERRNVGKVVLTPGG